MAEIPRWKVQAALRLLGLEPDSMLVAELRPVAGEVVVRARGSLDGYSLDITDAVEDTRMHVLGIDPENGQAVLSVVEDNDVKFYEGANMVLASGSKHANGTVCPVFKRRTP